VSTFVAPGPIVLHDRAAAEAYVALVCFKHGPPRRLGVELEWIVQHAGDPGRYLDAEHLAETLGVHAPPTLSPESEHRPLPCGSTVTVEPGGQVEISTPPRNDLNDLLATASADAATLADLLDAAGLRLAGTGADPVRQPRRLLRSPRYVALEAYYDRGGPSGRTMMCSTAAVQVCVDAGLGWRRWHALHALGPVLLAAFANSPVVRGVRTGWASNRMAAWFGITPPPPPENDRGADPARAYANRALDAHLVCVRRANGDWRAPAGVSFADWLAGALPRPPTTADLDYHLSTLFPVVRPRGHLEVRYLDAQPPGQWPVPLAVLAALLADDAATDAALGLAEPAAGRWYEAARCGLADPVLAAAATAVFELACRRLAGLAVPGWLLAEVERITEQRVGRNRTAADDDVLGGDRP
jgi:glutamate--cysteine ligase